jgi:hypothetical protein
MDAMQKRRIRKVAIVHFVLTVFCFLSPLVFPPANSWLGNASFDRVMGSYNWNEACVDSFVNLQFILQPQALFISLGWHLFFGIHSSVEALSLLTIQILTMPVWSFCFGWLFVKLDNWLNHFPVLGRKVF